MAKKTSVKKTSRGTRAASDGPGPKPGRKKAASGRRGSAKASGLQAGPEVDAAGDRAPLHDEDGRFAPGNPGGPGRPLNKTLAELRAKWRELATPEDLESVYVALRDAAKAGDVAAIKEFLTRTLGKPFEAPSEDEDEDAPKVPRDPHELALYFYQQFITVMQVNPTVRALIVDHVHNQNHAGGDDRAGPTANEANPR